MSADSRSDGAVPAAFYPDPAGGPGLRWWNGQAWTEHVQAPAPVAVNQGYAAVWNGAPNGYAAQSGYVAPSGGAPQGGYGNPVPAGYVNPGFPVPAASPTNGLATAALVIGLVTFLVGVVSGYYFGSLLAVLLSVKGLQRAKELVQQGYPPVGRARAAWGLGLSILMVVIVVLLKVTSLS